MAGRGESNGSSPRGSAGQVERTRQRIVDAALEVLDRKGLEEARVEDICQAAGSARATFYRHFKSKDDVFDVLLEGLLDELDALVHVGPITPDRPGYATLRELVAKMVSTFERWAPVVEAVSTLGRVHDGSRRRSIAELVRMSSALGEAIVEGGGGGGDPWMEGMALVGLIEGFGHQVRTWDVTFDRQAMIDDVSLLALVMLHPALDPAAVG